MERNFYNDDFDFEQLIKQKSDQFKMYPSDKVWKGVQSALRPARKWYWMGLALFLASIGFYTIDAINHPGKPVLASNNTTESENTTASKETQKAPIVPMVAKKTSQDQKSSVAFFDTKWEEKRIEETKSEETRSEERGSEEFKNEEMRNEERGVSTTEKPFKRISPVIPMVAATAAKAEDIQIENTTTSTQVAPIAATPTEEAAAANEEKSEKINWLQENLVYEFSKPKLKKLSWQLSFSPTMNYRKLQGTADAKISNLLTNVPIAPTIEGDIDNLVKHKPGVGFELGSGFVYALNKSMNFRAGVQFNYSQYYIQAYNSYSTDRATIALNNVGLSSGTITNYSRIRNFGGNSQTDLRNEYFQISAPIGMEFILMGRKRLQMGVAATVQPTYLLNRNNYLITTDYKNYTSAPSLVRRWNVNTGAEAFVSYKVGSTKIQLAPQFRYQLLSSYTDQYPIKEYLMEYGAKLTISKTIK